MGDPGLVLRLLLLFPFAGGYQRSAAAGGPWLGGIRTADRVSAPEEPAGPAAPISLASKELCL